MSSYKNISSRNQTLSNSQLDKNRINEENSIAIRQQKLICKWNNEYVGKLDKKGNSLSNFFNNIMLTKKSMIVQLYRENHIKDMLINKEGEVAIMQIGYQQIDNRKHSMEDLNYVDTPLPVINKGVIVAISPEMIKEYISLKNELIEYDNQHNTDTAKHAIIPRVGDIVYLADFKLKDYRYYMNKQERVEDYIKSQTDVNLSNFDFLFKIEDYNIESIVPQELANLLPDYGYKFEHVLEKLSDDDFKTVTVKLDNN